MSGLSRTELRVRYPGERKPAGAEEDIFRFICLVLLDLLFDFLYYLAFSFSLVSLPFFFPYWFLLVSWYPGAMDFLAVVDYL